MGIQEEEKFWGDRSALRALLGVFEERKAGIFRVGGSIIIKHASWHRKGGGDEEQYHLLDEWWIIT